MIRTAPRRSVAIDPRIWLVIVAALSFATLQLAGSHSAGAASKTADCRVVSGKAVKFNGRCRFSWERNGSFALESLRRNAPLYGQIIIVSVTIVGRGVAEVRGLTTSGINSRWGRAQRSRRDPACWVGSDFRICAY